jgi:hypothetical protein
MKSLLSLLAMVLLGASVNACGSTNKTADTKKSRSSVVASSGAPTTTVSSTPPPGSYLKNDGDTDADDYSKSRRGGGDDQPFVASYGKRAGTADKQAVRAVIKSYYQAAAAEDGARACSLLSRSLSEGSAEERTQAPGQTQQNGGQGCVLALSTFFKQQHRQLVADDVATMVVVDVHVKGNLGLAVLGFRKMPEGEIVVERQDGNWKIDALLDSLMT